MQLPKKFGLLLAAIWLILTGLAGLVEMRIPGQLLAILAIAAGVLIILDR